MKTENKHKDHYDKVVNCFNGVTGKTTAYCQKCGKELNQPLPSSKGLTEEGISSILDSMNYKTSAERENAYDLCTKILKLLALQGQKEGRVCMSYSSCDEPYEKCEDCPLLGLVGEKIQDAKTVTSTTETKDSQSAESYPRELQQLMDDISEWSDATFGEGQRNPAILYHLKKEVNELIEKIENGVVSQSETDAMRMEYADCFMLLFDSASHSFLSSEIILDDVRKKLEINKKRKWGKPDENGVVEHIKDK